VAVVEGITLVLGRDGATRAVGSVEASAGGGLEGDYHSDLTLIATEALEGLREDTGIVLSGEDSRRNVLTRGIDLNALVGRRFRVGSVEAVGVELAEPCTKLARLNGRELRIIRGLVHRGGLRADVVGGGRIAVGDEIEALAEPAQAAGEADPGR
jgi:MOSC domain-containing protein YiiM